MKEIFVTILGALLYGMSFGQTTNIGDHLTIKFPSPPDIQQSGNKSFYIVNDSSYIINVMFADMQDNPNFIIKPEQLTEFYNGFINGTLNAASDSKLLRETRINFGKHEGREVRYTKDFDGMDDIPVTKWILLIDKAVYTIDVWDLTKRGQKNLEKEIFESMSVQ